MPPWLWVRIESLLDRVRDGFWFVPSLMVLVAVVAGIFMPWIDALFPDDMSFRTVILVYDSGPEGARSVLAAIASSSITVGATVFSITIATLALTSQQYGPRLLRTFTSDRGVQFSLGAFLASFIYPLLVLRVVRTGEENAFVPHLSTTLAILLGVLSVGVLIYFIDHVSTMIRAPQIIDRVGDELDEVIDDRIPIDASHGDSDEDPDTITADHLPTLADPAVPAGRSGYVTFISERELVHIASKAGCSLRLAVGAGSYVGERSPLVHHLPGMIADERTCESIRECFSIDSQRTVSQDPVHGLNQLVELALRAISPGINDPFTAETCIDRLSAALSRLADRPFPDPRMHDENGIVRLVTRRPDFVYLVQLSFAPIRRYAGKDAGVLGRLLEGLTRIAAHVPADRPVRLQALVTQAEAVYRFARDMDATDRRLLDEMMARFNETARAARYP